MSLFPILLRSIGSMRFSECSLSQNLFSARAKNPDQAWEIQIGGNFYEALAKLKHAWDIWGSDPYLVTTERYEHEALKLLGGTFHEMKAEMRIINYRRIVRLHNLLKEATKLENEIGLVTK